MWRWLAERFAWLCPALAILLAAATLYAFGLSLWSALLAGLFLVCPALLVWGLIEVWRDKRRIARHRSERKLS